MHRPTAALLALSLLTPSVFGSIWPLPRSFSNGTSFLQLAPDFSFAVDVDSAPDDLYAAVDRTQDAIRTALIERLTVGRGSLDQDAIGGAPMLSSVALQLSADAIVRPIAEEAVQALGNRSESYSLYVPDDGSEAVISANSTLGLLRGLTSFEQLWYTLGNVTYTNIAPVTIENDAPAYPYRGFMLDTARNYFSVNDIKRTLTAMSFVKMSMFHWHIVDSQSFPLIVDDFPELAQTGAYSSDKVYTPDNVQDIVSYAAQAHVYQEIDMPGHTDIVGLAHPEYVACSQSAPWGTYAAEPPAGQLRFTSSEVADFASALVSSVAGTLSSPYFSTGGDEDEQFQQELNATGATFDSALDTFIGQVHGSLVEIGKTPVEMVLDQNVTLSNDTIVIVWVAEQNFKIVHGHRTYFYLDCGAGAWVGNYPYGSSWCDPFKSWQYADQASLVMGGQQLLWTEQVGPESLDSTVSAETFWTATQPDGSVLDVNTALPRLHELRYRLLEKGVGAKALQPEWCAMRPFLCNLEA
ncbi:glycoside hydrolase family 20 protein [Schizophyllum amplum]|uniref:Beta-hexosaminidase n=1 Tax=Schizophyllum amplum TaxID=97359 RepID=A0A550BWN7_9AGAR|nr:glycoside hydrolase family 20 protein [Auriculariopsis ampla]